MCYDDLTKFLVCFECGILLMLSVVLGKSMYKITYVKSIMENDKKRRRKRITLSKGGTKTKGIGIE